MGEMRSSKKTLVSLGNPAQQHVDHNIGTELTTAWTNLSQSKAALRHIENRLEAVPGTAVLESVMDPPKKKSCRTVHRRDGQQVDDIGGSSKYRGRNQQSPKKDSSRSPLRNATQDSNVRKNNIVEFSEPLASYREATPPPHPSSQLEAYNLQSVPGSSNTFSTPPSETLLSQLVYQRDTRERQTDRDLDSTHSSALESTEVRYLNDQPALAALKTVVNQPHPIGVRGHAREGAEEDSTPKAQVNQGMSGQDSTPCPIRRGESTPSSSPGSASQRLENLRRHQPDDKLEKLKERIRRQRQHLEEAAEREKLLGCLEQPITAAVRSSNGGTNNTPSAVVRKVAAAPPAPIYKGFNSSETKIRIPDGKVLKEEDFHNFSREIYRDLSRQFAESTRSRHQQQREQRLDRSKERRAPKPVRKVHKAASDLNAKPVIGPSSWREGQKLIKTVLGPFPKLPREDGPSTDDRLNQTASHHRSSSGPQQKSNQHSRPRSTDRSRGAFQAESKSHSKATSAPSFAAQDNAQVGVGTELLSADIQGILDDLQLECKAAEEEERARQMTRRGSGGRRGRGGSLPRTRNPVSVWGTVGATVGSSRGCRSASPTTHRPVSANTADSGQKRRHYDADSVRQYIAKQQEERRRRQMEEKKALREEAERRNQRLKELYRRQREVAKTVSIPSEAPVAPVQKRLQETYTKLLLEEAQLGNEDSQTQPSAPSSQVRPMYQPSGESDKENKRLEPSQSPSSSDRSLTDQPPLSRNDLDIEVASMFQPDHLSPAVRLTTGPSSSALASLGDHFLSHILRLETGVTAGDIKHTPQRASAPSNRSQSKKSRIEALKATAASLSNRIESEARKFAGEGLNYGMATSLDVDTVLASRVSQVNPDDGCWTETAAHSTTENNDVTFRIQRLLTSMGHSSYNGATLPGAGNLHTFKGQKENNGTHTNLTNPQIPSTDVTGHTPNASIQEKRKPVNGLEKVEKIDKMSPQGGYGAVENKQENRIELHDSSTDSISEGPILSEESLSEDERSPPRSNNHVPSLALEAVNHCAGHRGDYQRLSEFQKEAAKCSALSSTLAQDSSKAVWEELNKGSPLSVINIFTKNLQCHVKGSERNSPSAHSLHSGNYPEDAAVYEDDFVSSHSSGASGQFKRNSTSHSANSHFEELMKRSPYEKTTGGFNSHHSSFHSSNHSPHFSSGSTSGSSPLSKHSSRKLGNASDQSGATLVGDEMSSCSPPSKALSADSRRRSSDISSAHSHTLTSGQSDQSSGLDGKKSQAARPRLASPSGFPHSGSSPERDSPGEPQRGGALVEENNMNTGISVHSGRAETRAAGELQYSPAALQQRMAAELQYLDSIEQSFRQLGDVEKLMGVSMAQQESASVAHRLKAKQQRQERDLYELKIKAEREALETKLQLEKNRQRVAKAHIELQESLAVTQKETLESLQDATTKMMSQQAEAARYTADAARHIKEMTELARSQIAGALTVPADSSTLSQHQREEKQSYAKQQQDKSDSDSFPNEGSSRRMKPEEPVSSVNSLSHSDSLPFRRPSLSGADSSSHSSPSHVSADHIERVKIEAAGSKLRKGGDEKRTEGEAGTSSIEEEVPAAASDSVCSEIPSALDEKGESTSIATEYSLKFDESMTEDEIEERSFRSLLPSESHRRETLEKKPRHHEESEDDGANHNSVLVSGTHNILKNGSMAFSSGQDSFSQFTMEMVRQYMKDDEVRLQHQSSLLGLRQKALKEKIRTELAWLEHQKKHLRDKGEDDKMPPIRKKQRGLLMRLQQEQAEIKRLQEANKAARKERQLLLKQQEEIERMRSSTLRLKERLKSAGFETPSETPASEAQVSETASSNMRHADDIRSPSPSLSISGSETSSIMQKLKKMRSHMDEKHCSPVHYFFSVFTAQHWASLSLCLPHLHPKFQLFIYNQLVRFLTKREQQLMQRRRHAEELLQWKQRLDQEEAEVRRIEKEALAGWDRDMPERQKEISDVSPCSSRLQSSEPITDSEKDYVSEGDCFSATPESSVHTEGQVSQQARSPPSEQLESVPEAPLTSIQSSPAHYTQDFTSAATPLSRQSSAFKGSHSPAPSPSDGSSKTKMQLRSSSQIHQAQTDTPLVTQTETISDQSDIESRIKALKEELRKRKSMAYQLKKEQKKRHKERLKAQEASLLKQLESYDIYIKKTKAELNKEPDSAPDAKSQNKEATSFAEQFKIKPPAHRSETSKISECKRTHNDFSLDHSTPPQLAHYRSTSIPDELSEEDTPTVTPTPVHGSRESPTSGLKAHQSTEGLVGPSSKEAQAQVVVSGDENIVSEQRSHIQEELEVEVSNRCEDQQSECILKLEMEDRLDSQEKLSTYKDLSFSMSKEPPLVSLEQDKLIKTRDSSEREEDVQSTNIASSKSHSAAVDRENSKHPSFSHSISVHSHSSDPDVFSSRKEAPSKDIKDSSSMADGYNDDFEVSEGSLSREEQRMSKPASQISVSPIEIKASVNDLPSRALDSQDDEVEEEIAEELSLRSATSGASHESAKLLDLNQQTEDSEHDSKSTHSSHSQLVSPFQKPISPVIDEMSHFNIGDRVLVGGVQPGTLRFKGPTSFANGFWAGVELDKSEGSNNGTYDGVVYFECDECHGIFAPPDKISHLPDKFETYADTTEDEDSFFDDLPGKGGDKCRADEDKSQNQGNLKTRNESTSHRNSGSVDGNLTDESAHLNQHLKSQEPPNSKTHLNSEHSKLYKLPVSNDRSRDVILHFEDAPTSLLITDLERLGQEKKSQTITEREDVDSNHQVTAADISTDVRDDKQEQKLDTFADKLVNNFLKDTVKQLAQIKKAKVQKIEASNQINGDSFENDDEEGISSVEQKDDLPFFLPGEKEELSSPELCNRPESPVLGASGQEELAKRLAELELSRELLNELGEDQDWFDEDFGLSSRREQQRLKQKQREEEQEAKLGGGLGRSGSSAGEALGGLISSPDGDQQVKTPPRPALPLPLPPKLPEQPAMVVPHSASEVEKMVHAAIQEIWESCGLAMEGTPTLAKTARPKPSQHYLGEEASLQDQEALCIRSYRKAVYDLTWEILQEIYAEDPNADQPQWVKPRRVKSSFNHRVKTPGDITKIQEFIAAEVLKLYGLANHHNQKTDWQKMLKFGRKKRDRVDHILVQELHEEEVEWVNYDEDELFVKMQLADSIFDALLKDTVNVLSVISDKRDHPS
ncbi:centrosome-associated protein 350 [Aulostomus maculatus]